MLVSLFGTYVESFIDSTIHSFESRFSQITELNDEVSTFIIDFIRENYINGPSFKNLKGTLIHKHGV